CFAIMRSSFKTMLLLYHLLLIGNSLILTCTIFTLAALNLSESKKGSNLMVRRDQQIDASNFVYSIGRKNSALFENYRFKKGTTWFRICQSLKKGGSSPTS
ncbi:hypothetical protein, partial [Butyricicoccus pullicaecorum]|uniref:hypothetical protein n=1 Tax=Butyricicoccus pullicaecorum TaxID=501571 RepID=UPI00194F599E